MVSGWDPNHLIPSMALMSPATDRSEPPMLPMDHFLNL
jgi:hypothetical protein